MKNTLSESDIEKLLNELLSDCNLEAVMDVLFSEKEIIKNDKFVNELQKIASRKFGNHYDDYFDQIKNNTDEFNLFLGLMSKLLWKSFFWSGKDEIVIVTLDEFTIWLLYAISIKKCLGIGHAKEILTESRYYSEMRESINNEQKKAHSQCISGFSKDASRFNFRKDPLMRIFLHSFHGRNKEKKTKKKNIRRVIKRAERYAMLRRLDHRNGSVFCSGKHLVPRQFGEAIIRIYLLG